MSTIFTEQPPRPIGASTYSALPRLALPRDRGKTLARHFRRTLLRFGVLLSADLGVLSFVIGVQKYVWFGYEVPLSDIALAVLLGLILVRAYGRGETWQSPTRVFAGVGLGILAAGWASVNESPGRAIPLMVFVWAVIAGVLCVERWIVAVIVAFARPRLLSPERVLVIAQQDDVLNSADTHLALPEGVDVIARVSTSGSRFRIWGVLQATRPDTVIIGGGLPNGVFNEVVRAARLSGCYVLSASQHDCLGGLWPKVVWRGKTSFTELSIPELTAPQLALKRVVDFVGSAVGLVILSPLLAAIAVAVKSTSPGPVLFRQLRIGFAGRLFWMYKFRTMYSGADSAKESLAHLNASGDRRLFKIYDDPRVTRLGQLLRRWSLDELPQLVNVLRGDMSLVGPRPFFEDDLQDYRDEHFSRLAAKPGMTGLWQVRGRSSILEFEQVIRLDLEYIYNWSLMRDLSILLATIPAIVRRTGAQ